MIIEPFAAFDEEIGWKKSRDIVKHQESQEKTHIARIWVSIYKH
jgi:hypothetical protein